MPIDFNRILRNSGVLIVDANATISSVYMMLAAYQREEAAFKFILAPLERQQWLAVRWIEIEEMARIVGADSISSWQLCDVISNYNDLLLSHNPESVLIALRNLQRYFFPVEEVDSNEITTQEARERRDEHPARRLLVKEKGQVIGIITTEQLSEHDLGSDPVHFDISSLKIINLPGIQPPVQAIDVANIQEYTVQQTLMADPQKRFVVMDNNKIIGVLTHDNTLKIDNDSIVQNPINEDNLILDQITNHMMFHHWLEEIDESGLVSTLEKTKPLKANKTYNLKINLVRSQSHSSPSKVIAQNDIKNTNEILAVIDSEDFQIYGNKEQILHISSAGYSKNVVGFTIEPKRNSDGRIDVAFFYEGQCLHVIEYTLQVGGRETGEQILFARGRSLASLLPRKTSRRRCSLVIVKRENGYQFILTGVGTSRAFIPITPQSIAQLVADAHSDFLDIVNTSYQDDKVYQSEQTFIPPEVHAATLSRMAHRGKLLYQLLFAGNQSGADMATMLSQMSQAQHLHIEIIAEEFFFPWAMLYDGALDPVDPYAFWGFKHVIECIPEFILRTPRSFELELASIKANKQLEMAFVANTKIDDELPSVVPPYPKVIEQQIEFFTNLKTVAMQHYTTMNEFFNLFTNPQAPPLIYINCHAATNAPTEAGGIYKSFLILSDGKIRIDDLDLDAPVLANGGLQNGPLIFLNVTQSPEMTPYLYAAFVHAMLARGARGVLGTDYNMPPLFAAEFAQKLIKRFVLGNIPLGELLLSLRREYLEEKNNVLGLVYTLYGNSDLIITHE